MRIAYQTAAMRRGFFFRGSRAQPLHSQGLIPSRDPPLPKETRKVCEIDAQITCGTGCCDSKTEYCAMDIDEDYPVCKPKNAFATAGDSFCFTAHGDQFCVHPGAASTKPKSAKRHR